MNASRAGVGIAALIYALLLSLVGIADANRHDEGHHCMATQEWVAKLRVQLAEFEQKLHVECPASVWAGGLALPVRQPLPDAVSTTSGGQGQQTSGPAPPCSTTKTQNALYGSPSYAY